MEEEIALYLEDAKDSMTSALTHIKGALSKIRAGKVSPNLVDGVMVDYYGSLTPINQVAGVTALDARTLAIKPWEKNMLSPIERAIINANLGVNPQNDGETIRIAVPLLTEERRKELVKQSKAEVENGKVRLRSVRKSTNEELKKLLKDGASEDAIKSAEEEVQKLTDGFTKKLDDLFVIKEKDILTI